MLNRMERTLLTLMCVVLLCASCCALAENVTDAEITGAFVEESKEIGEVDLAKVTKEGEEQTKTYTTQETEEEFESNTSVVEINEKNFPDWTFRNYVKEAVDWNGDGKLAQNEIEEVKEIYIGSMGVKTLKGVEFFTKLEKLYCSSNKISTLNINKCRALKELYCNNNNIKNLDISNNNSIEQIYCNQNNLTRLEIGNSPNLEYLDCSENKLKKMDVSECESLVIFKCNENRLTKLVLGKKPKLETLICNDNKLKSIDIMYCPKLIKALKGKNIVEDGYFYWKDGSLSFDMDTVIMSKDTRLFPSKGSVTITAAYFPDKQFRDYLLGYIDDGNGYFTSKECKTIKKINLSSQGYYDCVDLSGIEFFTGLESLICSENKLTKLDIRKNKKLSILQCDCNKIKTIDIGNCPKLKKLLQDECNVDSGCLVWGKGKLSIDKGVILVDGKKILYPDEQSIVIDKSRFPDNDFRNYIEEYIDNGDGYLSPNERESIKKIDVGDETISDLSGIEYFINLEILDCSENYLTVLDMSKNSALRELDCSYNQISVLDVSKCTALQKLVCYDNPIQTFEVSTLPANLYSLALSGNWETDDESITCSDGVNLLCFPLDTVLYDGDRIIYQMVEETDE